MHVHAAATAATIAAAAAVVTATVAAFVCVACSGWRVVCSVKCVVSCVWVGARTRLLGVYCLLFAVSCLLVL